MAEEAKNDYRDNIDDVTVLRMGEILIAQEDIIQQTATGEKELIKAGSIFNLEKMYAAPVLLPAPGTPNKFTINAPICTSTYL